MTKEVIEKYIQFGIDNGYDGRVTYLVSKYYTGKDNFCWRMQADEYSVTIWEGERLERKGDLIRIITSKEFIEAVAKGLCKDFCVTENYDNIIKDKIKRIIIHQAKAIAEFEGDNLEEFIINLGILGQEKKG